MDPDVQRLISRAAAPKANQSYGTRGSDASAAFVNQQEGDESFEWLEYDPTKSSNPPRPRTLQAYYVRETQTLKVRFRDGTPWEYYNVPQNVWRNFRRSPSPGRFINRVLNNYAYGRGDF